MVTERKFLKTVKTFTEIVQLRSDVVLRKLAFDAFDGLLRRSPVDTGRFRASWRVGLGEADTSVEPKTFKAAMAKGSAATGNETSQQQKTQDAKFGQTIHLSNSLPYAQPLEDGKSKQASMGILAPTFAELIQNVDDAVRASQALVRDVK